MRTQFKNCMTLACMILTVAAATSGAISQTQDEVAGVVGLRPAEASSCIAIWIPIPDDAALSGFMWYNNDESTAFPEILLESGSPNQPVTAADAQLVAEGVQGESSGWSEVGLSGPVACSSEGLYLLFRFPAGSEYTADGTGGGAAMGYVTDGTGLPGWISADGQEWIAFKGDFGFALRPQFVDAGDATVVMKGAHRGTGGDTQDLPAEAFLQASPNPFNPMTRVRFNLTATSQVDLKVYNLRGERVRTLVSDMMDPGLHEAIWMGRDDAGRRVASGVYFARLAAGSIALTQRLVLIK